MRLLGYLVLLAIAVFALAISFRNRPQTLSLNGLASSSAPTLVPTPSPIGEYQPPSIATASSYTIIFTGDSMTEILGENFDSLRRSLSDHYPDKVFGLFNYGFGSTNILSLNERLTTSTEYLGRQFEPILTRHFDVIIIESMGYNPLSQYSLDQGLKIQTETLDRDIALIAFTHPDSVIIFLATIAPSQERYGLNTVDLSSEVRRDWANERRFYIENHINYAERHHIPLINVYEKSLLPDGTADTRYINANDNIHPSRAGIDLISREIADFLFQEGILLP